MLLLIESPMYTRTSKRPILGIQLGMRLETAVTGVLRCGSMPFVARVREARQPFLDWLIPLMLLKTSQSFVF